MGEGFVLTPRLRLVHTEIDFDDFTDAVGTQVSLKDGDRLDGALGLSAARESSGQDAGGMAQSSTIYGSVDLEHAFAIGTEVEVSGTALESEPERTSVRLSLGGSYSWADGKYAIFGEATASGLTTGSRAYDATAGLRVRF